MSQDTYVAPSIITSGTTFAQLQTGGLSLVLQNLMASNPAQANPTTQATVSATGGGSTGGNLPAGTYRAAYTWYDGAGETTIGSSESATFTISAGNIPQVTIPAVPTGACSANIYLTAAGGASGTETLYATGVTTTTFNMSYAAGTDTTNPTVPTSNMTGATSVTSDIMSGANAFDRIALKWLRLSDMVSNYLSGYPVGFWAQRLYIGRLDYTFAIWKQATKEIQTLIAGQAQSLHWKSTNVMPLQYRSFP